MAGAAAMGSYTSRHMAPARRCVCCRAGVGGSSCSLSTCRVPRGTRSVWTIRVDWYCNGCHETGHVVTQIGWGDPNSRSVIIRSVMADAFSVRYGPVSTQLTGKLKES